MSRTDTSCLNSYIDVLIYLASYYNVWVIFSDIKKWLHCCIWNKNQDKILILLSEKNNAQGYVQEERGRKWGDRRRGGDKDVDQLVNVNIPEWYNYICFSFFTVWHTFYSEQTVPFNFEKGNKRSFKSFWLPWFLKRFKSQSMTKAISKALLIEKQESLWPGLNGHIYHEYVIHVLYSFMKNALRQVCE